MTLRGYQLKRWRFGPETEGLVQETLARESWDADQWRRWRERRLPEILHHAATQVPYYREQWSKRRARGDRRPWDDLANWPPLTKEALRENPRRFRRTIVGPESPELHTGARPESR